MKKHHSNYLLTLAALLVTVLPVFADQSPAGQPTLQTETRGEDNVKYYKISSDADYKTFCEIVATGNPYANAMLTTDVTAHAPIGSGAIEFHYRGTFDGQGHTISLKDFTNTDTQPWGLFQYTEPGCVIKNLNVAGTIASYGTYMGSIVGQATGIVMDNCSSTVTVVGSTTSFTTAGGLIGVGYGKNFLKGCSFAGSLEVVAHAYGIIGHNTHVLSIDDCTWGDTFASGDGYIETPQTGKMPSGSVYVDYMGYTLDTEKKTATLAAINPGAVGTTEIAYKDAIKAIHVPENIIVDGETYVVNKIGNNAFKGSQMEYCYVPKTLTHIEDDAFNGCNKLKYLHIADCSSLDAKLYLGHKNQTDALFRDCPLEKVYIGRNLRWYTESTSNPSEPFDKVHSITDVFFGPRVSRVGNYQNEDARKGWSYDLFNDCEGMKRVYFMGDDQSLDEAELEIYCEDGFDHATDYYVNHTINIKDGTKSHVTHDDNGIFKVCANVTFGPFVKSVGDSMFGCNHTFSHNSNLKTVDFSNAYRLEKIAEMAFEQCSEAVFTGLDGQYPLTTVGKSAFANCEELDYINLGTQLKSIGDLAFSGCKNLFFIAIPGTVTSIGYYAFQDCETLQGVSFEDGPTPLDFSQITHCFTQGTKNIYSLQLNRNFSNVPADPFVVFEDSPFDRSDATLTNLTIGPGVTHLERGMFYGLNKITSVSFEYSAEPLVFTGYGSNLGTPSLVFDIGEAGMIIDNNPIASLRIDRVLHNSNGSELTSDAWGKAKGIVQDITFGEHVNHISERAYEGFDALKTLMFSSNVKEIGAKAFKGAKQLSTVSFIGPTVIGENAFDGCEDLKTIIVGDERLKVGANTFANCNSIEEVVINSDGNTPDGASDAFSKHAYENATLYSTYDTSMETVEFRKAPWKLFQKRSVKRDNDYLGEEGQDVFGVYEHASVKLDIDKGLYEMFYAPFPWDSYYFGSDAEIYSLSVTDATYTETTSKSGNVTAYDINVQPVDLLNTVKLPIGIYVVKTNYPAQSISATRNLFVEYNGIKIDDNPQHAKSSASNNFIMYGKQGGEVTDEDHKAYIFEDGVIKQLNGTHTVKHGSVIMSSAKINFEDAETFNIKNGPKTIFTSKHAVPFQGHLKGYATFYNEKYNMLAPEWCEVYVVTGFENGSVRMEKIRDNIINAGQAVILKTTTIDIYDAAELMTYVVNGSKRGAELYSKNMLRGVSQDTKVSDISRSESYVYALGNNSSNTQTGFYKLGDAKILSAGNAYLLPSDFGADDKECLFSLDDATTGIHNMGSQADGCGAIYDLSGRRVADSNANVKGVYIINNKKVIK